MDQDLETWKERLPKHWEVKRLGDVCKFLGGGTPSKQELKYWNGGIHWATIKDIKGKYLENTIDFISDEGLKNSPTNLAVCGDLILATRINPGKPIITKINSAINQDLKIVKPLKDIGINFLYYFF